MSNFKKSFNKQINIVTAYTFGKQGIGNDGSIPWNIPEDMKHFKNITTTKEEYDTINFSIVIMGRKTWDSLPDNFKPLPNRYNVVLTNNQDYRMEQNLKYH